MQTVLLNFIVVSWAVNCKLSHSALCRVAVNVMLIGNYHRCGNWGLLPQQNFWRESSTPCSQNFSVTYSILENSQLLRALPQTPMYTAYTFFKKYMLHEVIFWIWRSWLFFTNFASPTKKYFPHLWKLQTLICISFLTYIGDGILIYSFYFYVYVYLIIILLSHNREVLFAPLDDAKDRAFQFGRLIGICTALRSTSEEVLKKYAG